MSQRYHISGSLALGGVVLDGPEAHHLTNVSRVRAGDRVILFNGDGKEYQALVRHAGKKHVELDIDAIDAPAREVGFRLEVAAPLPKGDRAQFLIEKLTEIGVTDFIPLETDRSVVTLRSAHVEKLSRYVIEASKQCGRNVLMRIGDPQNWTEYAQGDGLPAQRLLAHPRGKACLSAVSGDVVMAVGPEGGFSEAEITQSIAWGWTLVGLGPRILRVETAAMVLAARLAEPIPSVRP